MKVVAFNTKGSFGDVGRQEAAVGFVAATKPDVAFFSEAFWDYDNIRTVNDSVIELGSLGYSVTMGDDNDASSRTDRTGFFGIVRRNLGDGKTIRVGTRDGYIVDVTNLHSEPVVRVGGLHFDEGSEPARLNHVAHLPELDVLLADVNAMNRGDRVARVLRMIKPFTETFVPEYNTNFNVTTGVLNAVRKNLHTAKQLARMAEGSTMTELAQRFDLHDVDPTFKPTIKFAQLDHILAVTGIEASDYEVHREVNISDHKPISATLTPRQ